MRDDRLRFNPSLLSLEEGGAICFPLPPVEFRRHSHPLKNFTQPGCPADFRRIVRLPHIMCLGERGQHPPDEHQPAKRRP